MDDGCSLVSSKRNGEEISKDRTISASNGGYEGINYCEYLMLEKVLNSQYLLSFQKNDPAHHEHLFIIIHQAYELWFKQIIFELDSVSNFFKTETVDETFTFEVIKRLNRIVLILKLLNDQIGILETMTAVDFIQFRDYLCPASGFQSLQFRIIERKLGLKKEYQVEFPSYKIEKNTPQVQASSQDKFEPSFVQLLQGWLKTMPWTYVNREYFLEKYKESANNFLEQQHIDMQGSHQTLLAIKQKKLEKTKSAMELLFKTDSERSTKAESEMSPEALLGALIVNLYQNEAPFDACYKIVSSLIEIDTGILKWRTNHMLMVEKMIGTHNTGTGGSSGYDYLKSTLDEKYKIFGDLSIIPTFLIPQHFVPSFASVKI